MTDTTPEYPGVQGLDHDTDHLLEHADCDYCIYAVGRIKEYFDQMKACVVELQKQNKRLTDEVESVWGDQSGK